MQKGWLASLDTSASLSVRDGAFDERGALFRGVDCTPSLNAPPRTLSVAEVSNQVRQPFCITLILFSPLSSLNVLSTPSLIPLFSMF